MNTTKINVSEILNSINSNTFPVDVTPVGIANLARENAASSFYASNPQSNPANVSARTVTAKIKVGKGFETKKFAVYSDGKIAIWDSKKFTFTLASGLSKETTKRIASLV